MNLKEHLGVSSKKMIDKVVLAVKNDNKLLEELFEIAYSEELKVSWRAV